MKKELIILFVLVLLLLPVNAFAQMQGHDMSMSMGNMTNPLENLRDKDFDRAFYSMMIPHHQAAVEMSEKILETTLDAEISKWAKAIIKDQDREIELMFREVDKIGGIDQQYAQIMEGHMSTMVEETRSDDDYLMLMIPHHESAVEMAELAKGRTSNKKLLSLAHSIIKSQNHEIKEFQKWLNERNDE